MKSVLLSSKRVQALPDFPVSPIKKLELPDLDSLNSQLTDKSHLFFNPIELISPPKQIKVYTKLQSDLYNSTLTYLSDLKISLNLDSTAYSEIKGILDSGIKLNFYEEKSSRYSKLKLQTLLKAAVHYVCWKEGIFYNYYSTTVSSCEKKYISSTKK